MYTIQSSQIFATVSVQKRILYENSESSGVNNAILRKYQRKWNQKSRFFGKIFGEITKGLAIEEIKFKFPKVLSLSFIKQFLLFLIRYSGNVAMPESHLLAIPKINGVGVFSVVVVAAEKTVRASDRETSIIEVEWQSSQPHTAILVSPANNNKRQWYNDIRKNDIWTTDQDTWIQKNDKRQEVASYLLSMVEIDRQPTQTPRQY